jgi:sterol desaturase/sphingolipid hydroxylase (fatty acid hydroxylase superfamily)
VIFVVIVAGIMFMVLERIVPDQNLPKVPTWWLRVIAINVIQLGVVILAGKTWDHWFSAGLAFNLQASMSAPLGGFVTYLVITFIFYWWHRWRHEVNFLWLSCHQLHHSPARIETITSFYKHPVELIANGILISFVNYAVMGLDVQGGQWVMLYTSLAEYFYHMNVRTPQWVGYFLQRPEMHRIHHQRGRHFNNFADLPLWDMLFGTYQNPPTYQGLCGFKPERELSFWKILAFQNVNNPFRK